MKSKQYCIKRFDRFVKGISQKDLVAIVCHMDADGLCSAVIARMALLQLGIEPALVFSQGHAEVAVSKETLQRLRAAGINKAIFADLSLDQQPKNFKKLEKFCSTLILDHHKIYNDLNSARTLMIKSQFVSRTRPSEYPASKLAFDLFSRHADLRPYRWVVAVGILGDMGLKRWRKFIQAAARSKGLTLRDLHTLKELISAVESVSQKNFSRLFTEFTDAAGQPRRLLKSKLMVHLRKFNSELRRHLSAFRRKAEFYPEIELVFYSMKCRHEIKSALINRISNETFPKKTVVVAQDSGGRMIRLSARRQDFKVRVNDLLEEAVHGLKDAAAGGHIPAAAGKVRRKDFARFKSRLIGILMKTRHTLNA